MLRHVFAALACSCLVTPAMAESKPVPGFEYSLFDGKTLNGWTAENGCEAAVQDGAILLKAGDGWLRSDHTYGDFNLHLEWKALKDEKYDAGIYIRTQLVGKPYPTQGHQINLLKGKEGNIGGLKGAESTGLIKTGEWNAFDIAVAGDHVSLSINGQAAYEATGLKFPRGYIGLQIEVPLGGQFLVKNIRVMETGYQGLFNGKDLAGWEGAGQAAETCWKAENDSIVCTGEKGPWLRCKQTYGDFNLRFEYQVSEEGNSGIYVRVPENGNHHRAVETEPAAGFEVQILDDKAAKHAKLKPYQYCGSVYDICGASKQVGRAAGEWNSFEINCRGQNITTIHNGVTIVEVTPESHPLINLRNLEGHIGLQNHSTVVRFRNLRVGPASN